tara:strand:- start:541 stop:687 length:147 start_codon:yes stop_codon:yes gene_type:complete
MVRKVKSYITSVFEPTKKRTSIGRGKIKKASMNKHKKRSFKKYRRQGR